MFLVRSGCGTFTLPRAACTGGASREHEAEIAAVAAKGDLVCGNSTFNGTTNERRENDMFHTLQKKRKYSGVEKISKKNFQV